MMVKLVTFEDTRAMLMTLAIEFPDRSVQECTYAFDDGRPNCIIGEAFARWGVPADVLVRMGPNRLVGVLDQVEPYLALTATAVHLLQAVQTEQDEEDEDTTVLDQRHVPWKEAVKRAFAQIEVMNSDGSDL